MRKKQLVTRSCGLLFAVAIVNLLPSVSFAGSKSGTVSIDRKHFPDAEFRRMIKTEFDKNHDGKLSAKERKAVKEIDTSADSDKYGNTDDGPFTYDIKNTQGIEYFTELTEVCFEFSSVKTIDLTKNPKLKNVEFFDSALLTKAVMFEGQTLTYSSITEWAEYKSGDKKLYCKSNNTKILSVSRVKKKCNRTKVTAKKAGKTTIKYTGGGSCTITVKAGTKTTSSLTPLTDKQVLKAITNYLAYEQNHGDNCGGAPCYWIIDNDSSNKTTAVVHFRAHTGAHLYYYIDRTSGDTYETIKDFLEDTENRTGVKFNARDYLKFKKN